MNKKIAVLANIIDPLFISKAEKDKIFVCCLENSEVHRILERNAFSIIPYRKINPSDGNHIIYENTALSETNLVEQLKKFSIDTLLVGHMLTQQMIQDAKKHHISLISIPFSIQKLLNNKKKFHNLLELHNISVPSMVTDISQVSSVAMYVRQAVQSFSMQGTEFLTGAQLVAEKFIDAPKVLVREYQEGVPLGVSIFLDLQGNYFISALRRQCFVYKDGYPDKFLGIQWMPVKFFSEAALQNIQKELLKLVGVLQDYKVCGCVNIDFILHDNKPYIIECNPRLSSATTQVFGVPNITAHPDPWNFYMNSLTGRPNDLLQTAAVPENNFEGCVLDVDILNKVTIKNILPSGWFEWNGKLLQIGNDLSQAQRANSFFLFHEIYAVDTDWEDFTLCSIIANFPLFELHTGELNTDGMKLYTVIKHNFIR